MNRRKNWSVLYLRKKGCEYTIKLPDGNSPPDVSGVNLREHPKRQVDVGYSKVELLDV